MAVTVRREIKDSNQMDEQRMRDAARKVEVGAIDHHRRMEINQLFDRAERNLDHLKIFAGAMESVGGCPSNTIAEAAADVRNYVRFIEERLGDGEQPEAKEK